MSMIGMFVQLTSEQFSKALSDPSLLEDMLDNADPSNVLNVEKNWEGIYFILTGSALAEEVAHPLGKVLFSYQYFDEEQDLGYGPGHYLSPDQLKHLSAELQKISTEDVKNRYDGKLMDEKSIYPEGWSEEISLKFLIEDFESLKKFYATAASENNAMVMYIS